MKTKTKAKSARGLSATEFDALPDSEKQKIYDEIEGMSGSQMRAKCGKSRSEVFVDAAIRYIDR